MLEALRKKQERAERMGVDYVEEPPAPPVKENKHRRVYPFPEAMRPFAPLPEAAEWKRLFPSLTSAVRERIQLLNPTSAREVAQGFILSELTRSSQPKTVIEVFPGKPYVLFEYRRVKSHFIILRSWTIIPCSPLIASNKIKTAYSIGVSW
jgi:hypothetical protein